MYMPHNPTISLLAIQSKEILSHMHEEIYTRMLIQHMK